MNVFTTSVIVTDKKMIAENTIIYNYINLICVYVTTYTTDMLVYAESHW